MTSKKFLKALAELSACVEAWFEIEDDHHTLRQFWLTTDREDWVLWLCVRVGLWGRVEEIVRDAIPEGDKIAVTAMRQLSALNGYLAADMSAGLRFAYPERFHKDIRALLTWREIETAINETIEKEKDND